MSAALSAARSCATSCGSSPPTGWRRRRSFSPASSTTGTRVGFPPSYVEDHDRPGFSQAFDRDNQVKFTWQASERNKFNFQWVLQRNCGCYFGQGAFFTPEATFPHYFTGDFLDSQHMVNATWTYPVTNRLLLEAKASYWYVDNVMPPIDGVSPDDISVFDFALGKMYGQLFTTNPFVLNASWVNTQGGKGDQGDTSQEFKVSYVTGSHSFKAGFQSIQQRYNEFSTGPPYTNRPPIQYHLAAGIPVGLAQLAAPNYYNFRMLDLGVFAQDAWTIDRLTLNFGVRYDHTRSFSPEFTSPGGYFLDEITWPAMSGFSNFHDITPRFSAAYDLTGSGKTALKFSIGRYVLNEGMTRILATHPALAITSQATRTWTDLNEDFLPDCNLRDQFANGECGALSGAGFGTPTPILEYSDRSRSGWGNRSYTWTTSVLFEQELAPGIAATVGYYRTTYGNIVSTDNRFVAPGDHDEYCVTAPLDTRLPGGGGNQVCGLYDVRPRFFGQVDNIRDLSNFKQWYNGVDVLINARFDNGAFIEGGFNTGGNDHRQLRRSRLPGAVLQDALSAVEGTAQLQVLRFVPAALVEPGDERDLPQPAGRRARRRRGVQQRADRAVVGTPLWPRAAPCRGRRAPPG